MSLKVEPFGKNTFPATFDVLDSVTLQKTDMANGNNKFYQLELHKAGTAFRIYSCYGRTGTPGKQEERICPSWYNEHSANLELKSIRGEKERKGYKEVKLATTSKGTEVGNSKILSTDVKIDKVVDPTTIASSIVLEPPISRLVTRLYEEAGTACQSQLNGSLKASAENPLGTLTLSQISEGKAILGEVNALLTKDSSLLNSIDEQVLNLTNNFYSAIPQSIPLRPRDEEDRKKWLGKYALNNSTILDEKADLLDLLADVQGLVSGFGSSNLGKKYEEINCDFIHWPADSKPYQAVKAYVEDSQSTKHYWKLKVKNVWQVSVKAQKQADHRTAMTKIGNIKSLFHGSRASNILGICKKGLLLRPPGAYVTGSMFGNGLYFADQSTKSSQYATARYGGTGSTTANTFFMFVTDVALGTIKEYGTAQSNLVAAPSGYHSVMGKAGQSLVHNEFIIYDLKQQELQYLVEFETY